MHNLPYFQNVSSTHRDTIFSQASLPKHVWDLAVKVMDLFENAKLKGQKLNLATLTTKPEFKQQYLVPIRSLDEADQVTLLTKVQEGSLSLIKITSTWSNFVLHVTTTIRHMAQHNLKAKSLVKPVRACMSPYSGKTLWPVHA